MGHWLRRPSGTSIPVTPNRSNLRPAVANGRHRVSRTHAEGVNLSMNKLKVIAVGTALSAAMLLPAVAEAGGRFHP